MRVWEELDTQSVVRRLLELESRGAANHRRAFVSALMQRVAAEIVRDHPIDTGRAVRGWQAGASAFGGTSGTGSAVTVGEGAGAVRDAESLTEAELENLVPYITHLEYGTRRQAPFAMVRRALSQVKQTIAAVWSETSDTGAGTR